MSELASPPSEEDVLDALSNVIDPELGLDFVELGLIYGVEIAEGNVRVTFTLTTPGCPIGPQVTEQIEEFVGDVEGVENVESEMVFAVQGETVRLGIRSPADVPVFRAEAYLEIQQDRAKGASGQT